MEKTDELLSAIYPLIAMAKSIGASEVKLSWILKRNPAWNVSITATKKKETTTITKELTEQPGWEFEIEMERVKVPTTKKAKRHGTDQSRDETERA